MNYLNKFTIKQRILGIFVFSIVFFAGFSILSIVGMNQIGNLINSIYDHPLVVSNGALDANNGVIKVQKTLYGILLTKDNAKRQLAIRELGSLEDNIYKNMDIVKSQILGEAGKTLESQTRIILDRYRDLNNQAIVLISAGQDEAATKIILGEGQSTFEILDKKIDELRGYAKNKATTFVDNANSITQNFSIALFSSSILICIIMLCLFLLTLKSILASVLVLKKAMSDSATTNNLLGVDLIGNNEIVEMSKDYNILIEILKNQFWIKDGLSNLNKELNGIVNFDDLARKSVTFLSRYLQAGNGTFYIYDNDQEILKLYGSYAFTETDISNDMYLLGNGIIGQVAYEKKSMLLSNINRNDDLILTGIAGDTTVNIYAFPLVYEDVLYGVIKLNSFHPFDQLQQDFLDEAGKIIAIHLSAEIRDEKIRELLKDTQLANSKMEEQQQMLLQQSEELQQTNTQLEEQQQILQQQSEELHQTNAQLEEQQQMLQQQSDILSAKNESLLDAQEKLDQRAQELETASNYKSQFLANMSHELRTPLNSIILLSKLLTNNSNNNLLEKDIEKAEIINRSGNELLRLINEVLDMSKIEAGKIELNITTFKSGELLEGLKEIFEPEANMLGLEFILEDEYNSDITSDKDKISQIVRNFLSNAFKFTKHGTVKLKIMNSGKKENPILISVQDTGIGIPENMQNVIFNAFQQADSSISRKYGGTGLGLFIAKELSILLHGRIEIKSEQGMGSEVALFLPVRFKSNIDDKDFPVTKPTDSEEQVASVIEDISITDLQDDRFSITQNDKVLLIIENDYSLSMEIKKKNNQKRIKSLIAPTGQEGVKLARNYKVDGVFLDLDLPDISGMDVLKEFKCTRELNEIPVCIISAWEDDYKTQMLGAVGYLKKPVKADELTGIIDSMIFNTKKTPEKVLLIENNEIQRRVVKELIEVRGMRVIEIETEEEGIAYLANGSANVIIIGMHPETGEGVKICKHIFDNEINSPVIGYTSGQLTKEQENELKKCADSVIINTNNSFERLLDEVTAYTKKAKKNINKEVYLNDKMQRIHTNKLEGKKILIVDDDAKNIFVLTAALEEFGVDIINAENGKIALEKLYSNDIDLVLMDIMMPVMDGLECIKMIRNSEKLKAIPVIALTAKALKGDREKCLAAGANDYISKPLDYDVLITLVKAWVAKKVL